MVLLDKARFAQPRERGATSEARPKYPTYHRCRFIQGQKQGQRTLNPLRHKNFHQEVIAPTGDLALAYDAVLRGMAFEQADREPAKP